MCVGEELRALHRAWQHPSECGIGDLHIAQIPDVLAERRPRVARHIVGRGFYQFGVGGHFRFEYRLDQSIPTREPPIEAVGSPQQVIDAIMRGVELLGIDQFIGQIDAGNPPWAVTQESLELYVTEVAPVLKRETGTNDPRQQPFRSEITTA